MFIRSTLGSRFEDEVRKKPKFDPRMVRFQNYYLGSACECSLDTHGRILIPPGLRKYADLKRDVVLVSALEKFRVLGSRGVEERFLPKRKTS